MFKLSFLICLSARTFGAILLEVIQVAALLRVIQILLEYVMRINIPLSNLSDSIIFKMLVTNLGISIYIPWVTLFLNSSLLIFYNFSLGAVHDGTSVAVNCSSSSNYMMTSVIGANDNVTNLYYFSNCSISSFKSNLLNSDMT